MMAETHNLSISVELDRVPAQESRVPGESLGNLAGRSHPKTAPKKAQKRIPGTGAIPSAQHRSS